MPFKHRKHSSPTSRKARVLVVQASIVAFLQDLLSKIFFSYESLNARNQEKSIPTSYLQGIISYVPQPRIPFFLFTSSGSQATRLIWYTGSGIFYSTRKPCAKAVPETDYLTQQKQYLKRTPLRTWTSQSQERDAEQSAPTITRLIHSASVLLGT